MRRYRAAVRAVSRRLVTQEDIWFDNDFTQSNADIVLIHHSLCPIESPLNKHQKTILIDLTHDETALWDDVKRDTRKNIRRAERDAVQVAYVPNCTDEQISEFALAYRELEIRKRLPLLDRTRLERLNQKNMLALTIATRATGESLSWHTYIIKGLRVRALNSVSHLKGLASSQERSFAGRAHRFHVWRDILFFKDQGLSVFDNGGYYDGEDPIRRSISVFKEEFGGKICPCYSAIIPKTLRGRVALALRNAFVRD